MERAADGDVSDTALLVRMGRKTTQWRRRYLVLVAIILATLPSVGNASTHASRSASRMEDDEVTCEDAQCLQLHRVTLACVSGGTTTSKSAAPATCGKCLSGFVDDCASQDDTGDASQAACQAAASGDGVVLRSEDAEDEDDDHHGGLGIQTTVGAAIGSVVVGLMCLVTWRGWLDCCCRSKRHEKNRAYMTASTTPWRCAICLHDNAGLRAYCVLCKTAIQRAHSDRQTVSISFDRDMNASPLESGAADVGEAYVLAETPRGDASLISERFNGPTDERLAAVERLEWKRSVSKDGSMQWKRYHAAAVRRRNRLQGTFVPADDCKAHRASWKLDAQDFASEKGFFIPFEMQVVTSWVPVDTVARYQLYKQWRKLPSIAALSFDDRLRWLYRELLKLRHTVGDKYYTIHVHRDQILKQTMHFFELAPPSTLRRQFRVDFSNEPGVDGGGILREWLHLVCKELFTEPLGLFKKVESDLDHGYWIQSAKRNQSELQMFRFFGMLLAKALLEGLVLNVRLSVPLLKHLLGYPLSRHDLRFLDQQIYASTMFILENDHIDELCLTFNVAGQDLISNGAQVQVTGKNKHQYVDRVVQHYLFECIELELGCILEGFRSILPDKLLHVFDFKELDLVLSGLTEIDVLDWRANTAVGVLGHEVRQEQCVIDWFWEIVEDMDQRERSRLLQYVTGSSGVPVDGFAALTSTDGRLQPFTIQLVPNAPKPYVVLPYASTCYNRLDIPVFKEKHELQQMLSMLISMDVTGFNRR